MSENILLQKLYDMYPDAQDSGVATRKQIMSVTSYIPAWLQARKLDRGLYNVSQNFQHQEVDRPDLEVQEVKFHAVECFNMKTTVPDRDANFVPFGNFNDVETIIKAGIFYPVYISGPSGNGKSTMVEQICAKHKKSLIRINLNMMSDEDQLIGSKTLKDGNVEVVEGPVLIAMRTGSTLLLDECLEENQEVRVGTIDNWQPVPLKDLEIGEIYPIVSVNMASGELENDEGFIISDKEDDVYEVELEDGRTIILNAKHPFLIRGRDQLVEKTIEGGLQVGDCVFVVDSMEQVKIVRISKLGRKKVRNLSVINNHTFITKNGIPTHNCDAGSANTLLCLQPILEGMKPFYFKLKNEIIRPAPGFNIIATANTKGKGSDDGRYIGTNVLNEAFLERFAVTFEQDYPPARTEIKIIKNLMQHYDCVNEEFAETLVKWADAIRRTFDDGGVDENITTRRMTHIVRAYSIFKKEKKAVELCCNRFDASTKAAFIDLFDKVSKEKEDHPEDHLSQEEVF